MTTHPEGTRSMGKKRKPVRAVRVGEHGERMTCNYCRRSKEVADMALPHVCADCYYEDRE